MIYYVWKYSKFIPNFMIGFKSLVASLFMVLIIKLAPSIFFVGFNFLFLIIILVIIYFVLLYIFKGISRQDINDVLNK
jgi:hypothetical protein